MNLPATPVSRLELASANARPLGLVPLDHPALRAIARPLAEETFGSPELARYLKRFWRVLLEAPKGVGLAAPQVGHDFALFLLAWEDERLALANPRRVGLPAFERLLDDEGCLSVPGFRASVRRAAGLTVIGRDPNDGSERRIDATGFRARILAHETDHLVGRLYLDLLDPGTFVSVVPVAIMAPAAQAPARPKRHASEHSKHSH